MKALRIIAYLEGISFLVLLGIAMPLKYFFNTPTPNKIVGMVHGLLFVMYVFYVISAKIEQGWPRKKMLWALLASIIPFGTFWADKKLFKEQE